ncbi:hypothetical protein ACFW5V_32550 [Streptomyces sp. NPDC058762]|uniref:hypothetical protein n=1 Tax=Streptomyces sp. NPDC058762 TaxID=3346629 RepID=UPI0036D16B67
MTASKPRRTMLPPNLTRNLYETRRLLSADEGKELPPWFALTKEQRHDAEMDMEVFRRAIIRAEEEQDLVASATATADTSTPFTAPAAADCPCLGCDLEAAVRRLLQQREEADRTPTDGVENRIRACFEGLAVEGEVPTVDTPLILSFDSPPLPVPDDRSGLSIYLYGTPSQRVFDALRDRRAYFDQRRRLFPPKV